MGEVRKLEQKPGRGAAPRASVRVTDRDHRGFVEFQFSLGDPTLYLEMTLPPRAFDEFCREHDARVLSEAEGRAVDAAENRWRYGDDKED